MLKHKIYISKFQIILQASIYERGRSLLRSLSYLKVSNLIQSYLILFDLNSSYLITKIILSNEIEICRKSLSNSPKRNCYFI